MPQSINAVYGTSNNTFIVTYNGGAANPATDDAFQETPLNGRITVQVALQWRGQPLLHIVEITLAPLMKSGKPSMRKQLLWSTIGPHSYNELLRSYNHPLAWRRDTAIRILGRDAYTAVLAACQAAYPALGANDAIPGEEPPAPR